jgi:hypothetical protein
VSDLKPDRQRRDLHKSNLPVTSRKIGPVLITSVAAPPLQTQTSSLPHPSTEGQPDSSESEEDTSQFVITPRSSAPDTTASVPPSDPYISFWRLMPKGEREHRFRESVDRGFCSYVCYFMHHVYFLALHCVTFSL